MLEMSKVQYVGSERLRVQFSDMLVGLLLYHFTSKCKYNWCWICGNEMTPTHYQRFNPMGCPGLGDPKSLKTEWPWCRICWQRIKSFFIQLLALILSLLIYPFFVAFLLLKKVKLIVKYQELRSSNMQVCSNQYQNSVV